MIRLPAVIMPLIAPATLDCPPAATLRQRYFHDTHLSFSTRTTSRYSSHRSSRAYGARSSCPQAFQYLDGARTGLAEQSAAIGTARYALSVNRFEVPGIFQGT